MTLSDTYMLNPASREFVSLSQRAVHGAEDRTEKTGSSADVTLPVLETQ